MSDPVWEYVRVERLSDGHILWITIDRPEVRNALHPPASEELGRAWDLLEADADLRVGVLTGAGDRAFCAGFDLKWAQAHPRNLDQRNVVRQGGFGGLTARRVLVPFDRLANSARVLAERIAGLPPLAVLAAKEAADLSQSLPLAEALRYQYPSIDRLFAARNRGD